MKIKLAAILTLSFFAFSCNLIGQIPPNNIIIEFSGMDKNEDISGYCGVLNTAYDSDTLRVDYIQAINNSFHFSEGRFSFEFNTSRNSIFFVSLKKKEETMTIYFGTIFNDAGYKYFLNLNEFQKGTFHLNLLSVEKGIQRDYANGSDTYSMTEFGLKIDSLDFIKCKISEDKISEMDVIKSYNKRDIEKGNQITETP